MKIEGGCYCGDIRYESTGEIQFQMQCHCRECQYITGGHPNAVIVAPMSGFRFTKGEPKEFARSDLETPVRRFFCGKCGAAIGSRSPSRPDSFIFKVGTMDDPSVFKPQAAIFAIDRQPFHHVPEGLPVFERRPTPPAKP